MSIVTCLVFAAVLGPLGWIMCAVSYPMTREQAGRAHRFLGGGVCALGSILVLSALVFLAMAMRGLAI